MEIDFDSAESISDYVTIPTGTYLCRVAEVRPGTTRAGDERWSMRLVVAEGQHVGKQAAWDNLVFSTRGRARIRLVMQALGLPASGKVEIEPSDLEDRSALVAIRPAEYQNATGQMVRRNEVPYDGYRAVPEEGAEGANGETSRETSRETSSETSGATGEDSSAKRRKRARRANDGDVDRTEIPF